MNRIQRAVIGLATCLLMSAGSAYAGGGGEQQVAPEISSENHKKALTIYEKTVQAGEISGDEVKPSLENLSYLLFRNREYEGALELADMAIEQDEKNYFAWEHRCAARFRLGHPEEAVADCLRAVTLNPESPPAYLWLGRISDNRKRFDQALDYYQKAVEKGPGSPLYLNDLAWFLATTAEVSLRNGDEAVGHAQKALTEEQDATLYDTLGAAYFAAGNIDKALEAYQKAIQTGGPATVAQYQRLLNKKGFPLPVDGISGPGLKKAMHDCLHAGIPIW